jgi:hypothetical protein
VANHTAERDDPAGAQRGAAGLPRTTARNDLDIQALQARLRRQAQERRRLNEEWLAIREEWSVIRTTRHQLAKCPRCIGMITATGSDGDGALGGGPRGAIA